MAHFCLLAITGPDETLEAALYPFWQDDRDGQQQPHFVFIEDRYADIDPDTQRPGYWRNPIGKWDGWVRGGNWSGLLGPDWPVDPTGANAIMGDASRALLARDADRLRQVHALLVRGDWQEAGAVFPPGPAWQAHVRAIVAGLADDEQVTVVDCHC